MPAFNKAKYVASLPVASATRRFSETSAFAGQLVHSRLEDLPKLPTRNEHILAILAHSRGELGTGCSRVNLGRRCEFAETVVLMVLWKGVRVVAKCTNCHFASDGTTQCGAVPAISSPTLHEAVQADETTSEGMEEAGEPQYSALPGHMRHRAPQQALQDKQPRTSAEFTTKNLERLPAFSDHS